MKKKYFVRMTWYDSSAVFSSKIYEFKVVGINGVEILESVRGYGNKAQCRNVAKKFAKICGLEFRE